MSDDPNATILRASAHILRCGGYHDLADKVAAISIVANLMPHLFAADQGSDPNLPPDHESPVLRLAPPPSEARDGTAAKP